MRPNSNFPTELSAEEIAAGFRLVESRIPLLDHEEFGHPATTPVAVLLLEQSFRLIKVRDFHRTSGCDLGYRVQSFGFDAHPLIKHHSKPQWEPLGDIYKTIPEALRRWKTTPLDQHWTIALPPNEPAVELPTNGKHE